MEKWPKSLRNVLKMTFNRSANEVEVAFELSAKSDGKECHNPERVFCRDLRQQQDLDQLCDGTLLLGAADDRLGEVL